MTLDEKIIAFEKEQDELMAALERRTKLEDKAIRLICECKFDEAMKVLASIDDDVAASDEEKPCNTEPVEEPCGKCMEVRYGETEETFEVVTDDFDAEMHKTEIGLYVATISLYGIEPEKCIALSMTLGGALDFIWNFDAKERRK